MKLKYLLLSTLLLTSCTANVQPKAVVGEPEEEHYFNIPYQYVREDRIYKVFLYSNEDERNGLKITKEWQVNLENTFHVFLYEYIYVDNRNSEILQDDFYVKGNHYTLVLYHYNK